MSLGRRGSVAAVIVGWRGRHMDYMSCLHRHSLGITVPGPPKEMWDPDS